MPAASGHFHEFAPGNCGVEEKEDERELLKRGLHIEGDPRARYRWVLMGGVGRWEVIGGPGEGGTFRGRGSLGTEAVGLPAWAPPGVVKLSAQARA